MSNEGTSACISKNVEIKKVPMSLKLLIKMHGGKINNNLHKEIKGIDDPEFMTDVEKIYQVARQNWDCWNPFSNLLREVMIPVDPTSFQVSKRAQTVLNTFLKKVSKKIKEV